MTSGSVQSQMFFYLMLIVLLIAAAVPFTYFQFIQPAPESTLQVSTATQPVTTVQESAAAALQNTNDLGSAIYQSASNPVLDKLPNSVVKVPNPIDNAYKNPFE